MHGATSQMVRYGFCDRVLLRDAKDFGYHIVSVTYPGSGFDHFLILLEFRRGTASLSSLNFMELRPGDA